MEAGFSQIWSNTHAHYHKSAVPLKVHSPDDPSTDDPSLLLFLLELQQNGEKLTKEQEALTL